MLSTQDIVFRRGRGSSWRVCLAPSMTRVGLIITPFFLLLSILLGVFIHADMAGAASTCGKDGMHIVTAGETLGRIAIANHTTVAALQSRNRAIKNPNLIYVDQVLCVPGHGYTVSVNHNQVNYANIAMVNYMSMDVGVKESVGHYNPFTFPQCTWGADEQYHLYHGVYVPWSINADAWLWTARAFDFHWQVSSTPVLHSIIVLQPYVQLSSARGHVGVVEQILPNGHVIASSTNWGASPYSRTTAEFVPGPGVAFVYQ